MTDALEKGRESLPGRGYLTGCGGFMSKMAVRADGAMVPCGLIPGMELGQINMDDLGEHLYFKKHPGGAPQSSRGRLQRLYHEGAMFGQLRCPELLPEQKPLGAFLVL